MYCMDVKVILSGGLVHPMALLPGTLFLYCTDVKVFLSGILNRETQSTMCLFVRVGFTARDNRLSDVSAMIKLSIGQTSSYLENFEF